MTPASSPLIALAVHARRVPLAERERFAEVVRQTATDGLSVETCHRVEWIGCEGPAASAIADALPAAGARLVDDDAARHVIEVAVGLDSVVVGEDQVLHQMRRAVTSARAAGSLNASVDRLVALALNAGRRARSWRRAPSRSLADVALAHLVRSAGSLRERPVLVVGSGEMGRLAAIALARAGGRLEIAGHSSDRAETIASAVGGIAVPFDPGARASEYVAIVVALSGRWPVSAATGDALAGGLAEVVDLSAPSAIEPSLVDRLGGRFIGIDGLANLGLSAEPNSGKLHSREHALVEATLDEFRTWLESRDRRTTAAALAARAERERLAELEDLWRRLPGLAQTDRDAIERMSVHLVERLLQEPVERLGLDKDGRYEQSVRALWAL